MSLLDEIRSTEVELWKPGPVEQRTIGGVPWLPFVPFGQGGPVHPSKYHIGERHALRLAPLYGAVRLIADGVASLPLKTYITQADGTKKLWTGPTLFDDPSIWPNTYYDWCFALMQSLLMHGNAVGYPRPSLDAGIRRRLCGCRRNAATSSRTTRRKCRTRRGRGITTRAGCWTRRTWFTSAPSSSLATSLPCRRSRRSRC